MFTARTHISNPQRGARSQLTLDVEIPLHNQGALRMKIHEVVGTRISRRQTVHLSRKRVDEGPRVADIDLFGEWRRRVKPASQLSRHGQHVKHSKTAADGGLAVLERIPCKTYARLPIFLRRIHEIGRPQVWIRGHVVEYTKVRKLAVDFVRHFRKFVP